MSKPHIALITGLAFEKQIADKVIKEEKAETLVVFNACMGARQAHQVVREAVRAGATAVVSFGVCGGLDPDLVAGDIVVPRTIKSKDATLTVDPNWHARLVNRLSTQYEPRITPLYNAETVITSVPEKADLRKNFGAGAVDMESGKIAQLAGQAGLPFVAVRVVHDTADQHIPAAFAEIIDDQGKPRILRLLKALIFNWPGLAVLKALSDADTQARTNLDGLTRLALPDFGFTD